MIEAVCDLALGAFGVGLCSLFYIGCVASIDSRHLSSVKRARRTRKELR